jgi:hypothetical protein
MLDLLLAIHTLRVENRLHVLMSLLSIEILPGSEEGWSDQPMTPELLNKAISAESQQYIHIRNLMILLRDFQRSWRYVAGSVR